jgi:hypothetical protein
MRVGVLCLPADEMLLLLCVLDQSGRTAYDLAKRWGYDSVAALLQE